MKSAAPGAGFAMALGAVMLVSPLSVHLFLPALPSVRSYFSASEAVVEAAFSIALITMAVVTPVYGSLSDRYGRRPVLLSGLSLFVVGSLFSALATSIPMLIGARLIQAMGAGCGITLARAIARDAYGSAALVKAIAYLTMAYTLGPMIAPALGGVLIDRFGWRSVFFLALLAGVGITAGAYFAVAETRAPAERRAATGLIHHYAALMRDRRFLAFALQSGFMSFQFFAVAAASPFLMKNLLGRSATEYGLYFILFPLGFCSGNVISSRLSGKVAVETMVIVGSVLCAVVVGVQAALIAEGELSPLLIFLPGGLMSFSQGLTLPNAQAGAIRIKLELAGTAAGLGVFIQMLLSALSAQLFGEFADGTPLPMIWITCAGAVGALACAAALMGGGRATAADPRPARPAEAKE
ncbi:MAG: multidrug effflux MFS transporter [Stellaceae bacterium]